jgi:hypothetical protein
VQTAGISGQCAVCSAMPAIAVPLIIGRVDNDLKTAVIAAAGTFSVGLGSFHQLGHSRFASMLFAGKLVEESINTMYSTLATAHTTGKNDKHSTGSNLVGNDRDANAGRPRSVPKIYAINNRKGCNNLPQKYVHDKTTSIGR